MEDNDDKNARRARLLKEWTPERISAHIAARDEWEKDMAMLRELFPQLFSTRERLPSFKDFCKSRQPSQP